MIDNPLATASPQAILSEEKKLIFRRLTVLWAFSESGLGGLLHAFRLPFTGLILGSFAVALLYLMSFYAQRRGLNLLKACFLVILIKFSCSPFTPWPAYLAVAFQGLTAAFLFGFLGSGRLVLWSVSLLCLLESALQKIALSTLLYGRELWQGLDHTLLYLYAQAGIEQGRLFSLELFYLYLGIYVLWASAAAWYIGGLPRRLALLRAQAFSLSVWQDNNLENYPKTVKRSRKSAKYVVYALATLLLLLLAFAQENPFAYLLRSLAAIVIFWVLLPAFLRLLLHRVLKKDSRAIVSDLLPDTLQLYRQTWRARLLAREAGGGLLRRNANFFVFLLFLAVFYEENRNSTPEEA